MYGASSATSNKPPASPIAKEAIARINSHDRSVVLGCRHSTEEKLTFAGWTKKIAVLPTIAAGSVGLDQSHQTSRVEIRQIRAYGALPTLLDRLVDLLERAECLRDGGSVDSSPILSVRATPRGCRVP